MGTTYFLFIVRSSSLRLGCGQKHKPVTDPELRGVAVAAISTDHSHHAPCALPPRGPHLLLGKETDARRASKPQVPQHRFIALPGNAASGAQRSARPRPGGLRRRLRPRWPGWAGPGGRARGERGATGPPARPRTSSRPPATHVRRGLPGAGRVRAAKCAQLTQLPGRAAGRPSGRTGRGTSRGARRGGGPHLAQPPPPTGAPRQAQRAAARRAPKESPGGADAEALELTTSSGRGGGSRRPSALRAGELAARGRRQLTGGTAGRSSRRSWNRSGQD